MPRSTALHMSYSVKAATLAAVNASISTPVCPASLQPATMRTRLSLSRLNVTLTLLRSNG
ncbi:hypothetical protein D3C73_1597660 [compost metagenome]